MTRCIVNNPEDCIGRCYCGERTMLCFKCYATPHEKPLFRQNAKGEAGIWACEEHSSKKIDPVVKEITDAITEMK